MKPLSIAVLALGGFGASVTASAGVVEDRIAELERQLEELKAAVAVNSQTITTSQEEIEEARPMAKGTRFTYGGYIQADMISSSYGEGKPSNDLIEDFLVGSLIPVEPKNGSGSDYTSTHFHAKSSRFYFTTRTPTKAGTVDTRIELDFILSGQGDTRISNSWSSRMRHAYINWQYDDKRSIMAGQYWSTFFNVGTLPDLLDFVGPVGTVFDRQPLLRWTSGPWQLALENPTTRLNRDDEGSLSTRFDDFNEGVPDFIARYNGKIGDLNWSAAGIARELTYEDRDSGGSTKGDSDERWGYGVSLAGKWMLGRDDLRFMFSFGDALGRYMGLNAFNDGYVDDGGNLQTIDQWGGFIAYRHSWSEHWMTNVSLSMTQADNPSQRQFIHAEELAKQYGSLHINLKYIPTPKLALGGELIYATKELEDGRDGDMSRMQFAVKYAF
jgi:hypothetical protein